MARGLKARKPSAGASKSVVRTTLTPGRVISSGLGATSRATRSLAVSLARRARSAARTVANIAPATLRIVSALKSRIARALPPRVKQFGWAIGTTANKISTAATQIASNLKRLWDTIRGKKNAPSRVLQAARQRIAGQIEEVARRRSLGTDPASGRYRVLEEQAALRLEQHVGPLRRDPSGTGDWLDVAGRSYDAVGPVPIKHIDTASFVNQINRHLNKQGLDKVVVDLTGFNSAQRRVIFDHLRTLDQSQLQRIHIQRSR